MTRVSSSKNRRRGGLALTAVLLLLTIAMLAIITLANLSITSVRLTARGQNRAIALSLAEAGVDNTVDEIRRSRTYTGTGGTSIALDGGTFQTTVSSIVGTTNLLDITSVGTTTSGRTCEVRARVNYSGLSVGYGAMISNGDINVNGSVTVQTSPASQHNANLLANGNITIADPATKIDGALVAGGTVSKPASVTYTEVQSGAPPIAFPTPETIADMKAGWLADAHAGGDTILPGGSIKLTKGTTTFTGPQYIKGDIVLSSNATATFSGTSPIYIDGNITMSGKTKITNSVNLIVSGTITQSGSSSSGYPTYDTSGTLPSLISLSSDLTNAITLTGNSNSQYAMVYAVNGGITVSGSSNLKGTLVAGGVGASITSSGNYTHTYPDGSTQNTEFARAPVVTSVIEM